MKSIQLPKIVQGDPFGAIDPLDSRYYDAEIAQYLSERTRIACQAHMEAALAHTLADYNICSRKVADEIESAAAKIDATKVAAEEVTTRHDIKALVNCIKAQISDEAKPYVHFGATSYDIIASASALQMKLAINDLVIPRVKLLITTLLDLTERYADTTQIGRTHGQHAVPVTFGFAMAEYVSRLGSSMLALEALSKELHGKFSGAVGAYNALSLFVDDPLEFEKVILGKVGLPAAEYSTQIVPPEAMVRLIDELTVTAGIMANLGHDMRHLQRSEIGEVRERFEAGQTGSSTMAHKKNPWNFENVVSMSKQVIAQSVNANMNLTSEHQRDLTDSASARFFVVSPALVSSMASRLNRVMSKLEVDEQAMERNLALTGGAIAAEPLYLLLEKHGHIAAHEMSKNLAHKALSDNKSLVSVIADDPEALKYWNKFTASEQQIISEPEKHYTGLASRKAHNISRTWRKKLA